MTPRRQHPGWTSRDIRALVEEVIAEYSMLGECQPSERMVDITCDTDPLIPLTDRIMERYTKAHIDHNSESTNDDFAEDLDPIDGDADGAS
jgi:hypothetical protein